MNNKIAKHKYQTDPKDGRCKICRKYYVESAKVHINRNESGRRYL